MGQGAGQVGRALIFKLILCFKQVSGGAFPAFLNDGRPG